jgi:hypothetical protein
MCQKSTTPQLPSTTNRHDSSSRYCLLQLLCLLQCMETLLLLHFLQYMYSAAADTDLPFDGSENPSTPSLQCWQKPARSAPPKPPSSETSSWNAAMDTSCQRAAHIVAAAATEAAAAAAAAVVAAAGKRIRDHMDLLQLHQGGLSHQMQAALQTLQPGATGEAIMNSQLLPPVSCTHCQVCT